MEKIKIIFSKLKGSHAMMMAGCIGMMAAFILLPLFGIDIGKLGFILLVAVCMVMHLFMMRGTHKKHNVSDGKIEEKEEDHLSSNNPAQD